MNCKTFTLSILALAFSGTVAQAASYTGVGAVDFTNPANWQNGVIPSSVVINGNNVSISDGLTFTDATTNWLINGEVVINGGNLVFNNGRRSDDGIPAHTTLDFGVSGKLAVNSVLNFSHSAQNPDSTFSVSATLVGNTGVWNHRTLITANEMWNVEAFKPAGAQYGVVTDRFSFAGYTLSSTVLASGYNEADLDDGFAYLCYDSIAYNGQPGSISVVFKGAAVPEPTTATLGLLGLATLMLRRRRA